MLKRQLLYPASLLHTCLAPPHLAADTESLQWVEAEPAAVSSFFEAVHKLCVERPLERRQTHQDHMLLLRRQLVLQDIMTSSETKTKATVSVCYKRKHTW